MIIFDGKKFAAEIETKLKAEVDNLKKKGVTPKLLTILVGDNKESVLFLKLKAKFAPKIGIEFELQQFPEYSKKEEIIEFLHSFNNIQDKYVRGLVVQLPLPKNLEKDKQEILDAIDSKFDIDGLTTASFELLKQNKKCFLPGVVRAVKETIDSYNLLRDVKMVGVIGAKGWVGSRICLMLKNNGIKEILEFDQGDSLSELVKADLIISSVGKPNLITADLVKEGAVIFDLGVMVVDGEEGKKTVGDVDFANVAPKTSFITPVPGGIGPATIACLFKNLVENTIV